MLRNLPGMKQKRPPLRGIHRTVIPGSRFPELPGPKSWSTQEVGRIFAQRARRERGVVLAEWLAERLQSGAPILSVEYRAYEAWAGERHCVPVAERIWWSTIATVLDCPSRVVRAQGRLVKALDVPCASAAEEATG